MVLGGINNSLGTGTGTNLIPAVSISGVLTVMETNSTNSYGAENLAALMLAGGTLATSATPPTGSGGLIYGTYLLNSGLTAGGVAQTSGSARPTWGCTRPLARSSRSTPAQPTASTCP